MNLLNKQAIGSRMRLSFFIILLINIFLSVGCTPKGKSPVPKSLLADIDVVRSLKTGELADNRKIQNDYNLKLKLLKKITVLDVSEGGELVGITHQGNCLFSQFQIARRINNSDSYKNFLASCNNKLNYYHKLAVKRLSVLRKLKAEEQKPEPELLTYLKTFKKVDKAKHNLGFYYDALLKEGVESVKHLQDVTTEDLLDLGLSRHRARKIGKTFAEIAPSKSARQ